MKINSCCLKVIGSSESSFKGLDAQGLGHHAKTAHSSSRPDHTQTRPIKKWVIMHSVPMKVVRNHLLLGCPCCQPGVIMKMYLERARKLGRVNEDVLNLARWVAKGRPTRLTRQVYKDFMALKAIEQVHQV